MTMPVSFFTSAASLEASGAALEEGINMLDNQDRLLAALESEIRAQTGARHAITCNSGTDALIGLLIAAGVGPGDDVIVPAYSFFASASCVVHVGATPIFADVDPRSYALTAASIESAITERTTTVLVVHLFHTMADMRAIVALCNARGLILVEDSAEAIGMRRDGVHAGLFGAGGVLSFFPTKTWGGVGDAGAVITDDDVVAERARLAFAGQGDAPWTSRVDAVQAATLLARARTLDAEIAQRENLADRYHERLRDLSIVQTPEQAPPNDRDRSVWYVYVIETPRRSELVEALTSAGVGSDVYYPKTIADQPCFAHLEHGDLSVARAAATRSLALPLHADMDERDVDEVCDVIVAFENEVMA
jgi:dTDP-4-amino-4,6-dideoxygalactose transaminase